MIYFFDVVYEYVGDICAFDLKKRSVLKFNKGAVKSGP